MEADSDDGVVSVAAANPQTPPPAAQMLLTALRANYVWDPTTQKPQLRAFAGQEGPTSAVHVGDSKSPYDYFKMIFTDDLVQLLVTETNRYAAQSIGGKVLKPKSRLKY